MHKFNYNWTLKDANFTKDKGKVFSCFSCGGGSSLGYKIAGFDVIGNLEIDPKKNAAYVKNHNPKYNFNQDIREFRMRDDLPEELYNLDILDGSPPCIAAGTLVMTSEGYKDIVDVKVGDFVLTHANTFKEVVMLHKNEREGYYEMRAQGCTPIDITDNHPMYVRTLAKGKFSEPYWKDVKDLSVERTASGTILSQDYIGIAINPNSEVPTYGGIEFNEDFLYFLGRWFGDGWYRYYKNDTPPRQEARYTRIQGECRVCGKPCAPHKRYEGFWSLYCSKKCKSKYGRMMRKKNRANVIVCCGFKDVEALKERFDKLPYGYTLTKQKTTYRFEFASKELCEYIMQFGKGSTNKRLTKDILNLPTHLLKVFLEGYFDADGCYSIRNESMSFATVSKELAFGLEACIHKVFHTGCRMQIRHGGLDKIEGRIVNTHDTYHVSFKPSPTAKSHSFYLDGMIWTPFKEKNYISQSITTYNISVLDDNSYTINNLVCHNCLTFSMAGSRDKNWGEVFKHDGITQRWDDLYFEFIELAKKLQPKVVIAENVKGMLLGEAIDYVRRIYDAFDEAGYYCQHFLLNSAYMGVPQRRERVFFVCLRKDLAEPFLEAVDMFEMKPYIDMEFNEEPITCRDCNLELGAPLKGFALEDWTRLKNGEEKKYLQSALISIDSVHPTITEGYSEKANPMPEWSPNWLSDNDLCKVGSFPSDYDFNGIKAHKLIGRSVPPCMAANIASRVYEYWLSKL